MRGVRPALLLAALLAVPAAVAQGPGAAAGGSAPAASATTQRVTCTCSADPAYRVCSVEREGLRRPRRHFAVDAETYVGWRAYRTFCRVCHAEDSHGAGSAPDLVAAMRRLDRERFARIVADGRNGMPAWAGNPLVRHEYDALWTFLRARADGALAFVPGQRLRLLREAPGECDTAAGAPRAGADAG